MGIGLATSPPVISVKHFCNIAFMSSQYLYKIKQKFHERARYLICVNVFVHLHIATSMFIPNSRQNILSIIFKTFFR